MPQLHGNVKLVQHSKINVIHPINILKKYKVFACFVRSRKCLCHNWTFIPDQKWIPSKLRIEGNFNLKKKIYEKTTYTVILNDEKLITLLPGSETRYRKKCTVTAST